MEAGVELVVVPLGVVVGSSSSSYAGVPSSSIVIVMPGSVQPGGNLIEPGGYIPGRRPILNPQNRQFPCDGQKSCASGSETEQFRLKWTRIGGTHETEMAVTPEYWENQRMISG